LNGNGLLRPCLVAAGLLFLVVAIYGQVGNHEFVNIDDPFYITSNAHVLGGLTRENISWAFTNTISGHWHPPVWLSHMLDVELFGRDAGWHHRENVLIHLLNTELLFFLLWRMTGGMVSSAVAAALFGVHPLHVESVAWASERKDLLCAFFWLLAIGAYVRYAKRRSVRRYLPILPLFTLALMCKPMPVTLPFALLLLDYWPLGRVFPGGVPQAGGGRDALRGILRLVPEKIPLLVLSAVFSVVAVRASADVSALGNLDNIPFGMRFANAAVSYASYLGMTAWPSSLGVYYPHPASIGAAIPAWKILGACLLLAAITAVAVHQWRRRPYLPVGWFWYLGTLVPVIGLTQIGNQAMADRYTYVPLIGIFIALAWGVPALFGERKVPGVVPAAIGAVAIAALSVSAWNQAGYWKNDFSLYPRAIEVAENNWFALNNLGVAWHSAGESAKAIGYFQESLRIKPTFEIAWNNLGIAYEKSGRASDGIPCFREALRIRPGYAEAWVNLGLALGRSGNTEEGIQAFRTALRINPDDADAWGNLGVTFARAGRMAEAVPCFEEALRIRPGDALFRQYLAMAAPGKK
jgi:tetratricopeptide (TPR) repeat protein